MSIIKVKNLSKHFKVLNRREGLTGSIKDLFSQDYRIVNAVNDINFEINKGEIVGYIGPNGAGKSTTIKMRTGIFCSPMVYHPIQIEFKMQKKWVWCLVSELNYGGIFQ